MTVQAITWALQSGTKPRERLVLIVLANYADEEGVCWPSQARMARETGYTRQTVSKILKALCDSGYITRTDRLRENGSRTSSMYVLKMEEPQESACKHGATPPVNTGLHPPVNTGLHPEPPLEPPLEPTVVRGILPGEALAAYEAWNEMAARCEMPKAQKYSTKRQKDLRNRLKECGGIEGWKIALKKAESSKFLNGESSRGFVGSLDFILKENNFTKLMEGNYDGNRAAIGNSIEQDILAGLGLDGGSGECADASGGDGSGRYSDQLDPGERKGICGGDGSAV